MDRITFINELSQALSYRVRPREVHQLVEYYDEMILDLMEDGLSEAEAVAKLGDPEVLAQEAAGEIPNLEYVHRDLVCAFLYGSFWFVGDFCGLSQCRIE